MTPHMTKQGADLYESMFTTERLWESMFMALGLDRYSQAATGINSPELRAAYLEKCNAAREYFDYLATMRQAA